MSTSDTKRPAHHINMRLVTAAIWKNELPGGAARYSTTLDQLYQDDNGAWCHSKAISRANLLDAAEALRQAAVWINADSERQRQARRQANPGPPAVDGPDAAALDAAGDMSF